MRKVESPEQIGEEPAAAVEGDPEQSPAVAELPAPEPGPEPISETGRLVIDLTEPTNLEQILISVKPKPGDFKVNDPANYDATQVQMVGFTTGTRVSGVCPNGCCVTLSWLCDPVSIEDPHLSRADKLSGFNANNYSNFEDNQWTGPCLNEL